MGIVLGRVGLMGSPLWAESETSQAIRAQFSAGGRPLHMMLWVSSSGIIEGHCGGHVLKRRIRGSYRAGEDLRVRVGGSVFGDTLYLDLRNSTRIVGTIGGRFMGCGLKAEVYDHCITAWIQDRGIHRERFEMELADMEPGVALMMGVIACYHSYFVYPDPAWS